MTTLPKISIIIPTYKRAAILKTAVHSALNQTHPNIEVLVVDDASPDNTAEVVTGIHDTRVRYIRHEKNAGLSASRNSGIKESTGEFVCFLDDDDEIHPEKLEKQLKKFTAGSADVGVIYCAWQYVYQGKVISTHRPRFRGQIYSLFLEYSLLVSNAPLVRRVCFEKAGMFDTNLESSEDWDMWIRIAEHYKFDFVPDVLATIYTQPGPKMSLSLPTKISARRKIIEKYKKAFLKYPRAESAHLGRLGALEFLNGNKKEALRLIFQAVRLAPLRGKNYVYLILLALDKIKPGIFEHFVIEHRGNIKLYY